MQFVIEQEKLNAGLSFVARAVPSRPTHPVLANILLFADQANQTLSLTAFDLSLGIYTRMAASVEVGGRCTLPAKLLSDIISRLPQSTIAVANAIGEQSVTLKASSGEYQIRGMGPEEYPELPQVETGKSVQLSANALLEGLRRTLFATSPDEAKQILTGVHLKIQAGTLEFASTDGHRLAVVQTENIQSTDSLAVAAETTDLEVTIPARALREVERMVSLGSLDQEDALAPMGLRLDESQVIFEFGNQRLNSRKLEGAYPAYNQLIPQEFSSYIDLDRRQLLGALERIAILASQKNDIIKCTIDRDRQMVCFSAEAAEVGNALESLSAQISGDEPEEVAFNVKYLLEGLKVFTTSELQICLNTATSPVILRPLGELKMTYLVMPVQIRS
ncbi:MAG: DNA polymerase III subunit beta [Oscillatoriales cyanobacterium RM2_1_1]|nr:DNA polymerase III subunit beta [Oscillatoriales cyanobacterium SM2_3_0]NJO46571.1 DNA polymerase III subunit beta [Oscillatoriales cyanobacterium RM2_1_1]